MPKLPTRRNSNRIPQHDYSTQGYYFVTICVENRQQIFGTIDNNKMIINNAGNTINFWWGEITRHFPNIELDEYIIMPNHVHGIINIVGADRCVCPNQCAGPLQNNIKISNNGRTRRSAPTIFNIIQWFKTMSTNEYIKNVKNNNWPQFNKRLWQRSFHDHIIRNEKSLNNIREYIRTNPATWDRDVENPNNIDNIELNKNCITRQYT